LSTLAQYEDTVPRRRIRRTYHHGDLRQALIAAATELLATRGPHGVTLREAARRAGVSQAAPYRHFASKEALLATVAEESFAALARALAAGRDAGGGDAARRLRQLAGAYLRFAAEQPSTYRLMWSPVPSGSEFPGLRARAGEAGAVLFEVVRALHPPGEKPDGRGRSLGLVAWALLHGLAGLVIDEQLPRELRDSAPLETLASVAMDVLLDGVRGRRP
jgi:AcrR family transcriptional regulator